MRVKRLSMAASSALIAALALGGCSFLDPEYPPGYVETRKANLEAAVGEFDAASLGPVICDVSSGKVSLNNGFRRKIVLDGAKAWQPTIDRLDTLGYDTSSDESRSTGTRQDGLSVTVTLIANSGDEPEIEKELANVGCEMPPSGGVVSISFLEGDPA
jgi:hypothetical protein